MSLSWYLKRIKTFSVGEILYRIRQQVRTRVLDALAEDEFGVKLPIPYCSIIESEKHRYFPIFESNLDIYSDIDWHLDLSTGKRFPQKFAHKIDIRSDRYGSAKHVWEVNRMQFMLQLAIDYRKSGELKYLVLFCHHLATWKEANSYLVGVNWYSNIEVNLRLICWYFCWQMLNVDKLRKYDSAVNEFLTDVWTPLINSHAEYSYQHPSLYSSANNHLVSEYAGLFVAACCWNIPHRKSRLKYAMKGLESEILKQNTPEGVNREEAAEYIQFIDDFFLIAAVVGKNTGHDFSDAYKGRLRAMADYMNAFLDCGRNYPMYGDGDDGFVLRTDASRHYNNFESLLVSFATYFDEPAFKRPGLVWDEKNALLFGNAGRERFEAMPETPEISLDSNRFFTESGHYIFRKVECAQESAAEGTVRETYLHFDAAPLGFLSIAAHGHADALSFILHVDGNPVIVDPGTFTYHTHKDIRAYFVSTLAHNTVCVNGKNQAEQAGPTMWLNHYHCRTLESGENFVEACHDGYASEGVLHTRRIEYSRDRDEFTITDTLSCSQSAAVEIPFHLHPSATVTLNGSTAEISVPGSRRVVVELDSSLSYAVREDGWYSEHFGEKVPTKFLYAKTECSGDVKFVTKIRVTE